MDESNEITREWQDEIRGLFLKEGIDVDGGGCESGDPFDFTKSEVAQGICKLIDRIDEKAARIERLEAALNHQRNKLSLIVQINPDTDSDTLDALRQAVELAKAALEAE